MANTKNYYVQGRDKNQLLEDLMTEGIARYSKVYQQQKMGIFVRCTEDLEAAIHAYKKSSDRLANVLLWLNIILGIFTVAGTAIGVYQLCNSH